MFEHFKTCLILPPILIINAKTRFTDIDIGIKVNDGLPDTSYLKMIDIWLFFNLLVPFILIIIHTIMETLRCTLEKELINQISNILPGIKPTNSIRNRDEEEQLELK